MYDVKRMARGALGWRVEVPGGDNGGRNIERCLRDRYEELQVDRAIAVMVVEPRGTRNSRVRGVTGDVRVNPARTVMIRIAVGYVRVHERSAERPQRDRHRQRRGRERSEHSGHSSAYWNILFFVGAPVRNSWATL